MGEIVVIIETLENSVAKLISKLENLEQNSQQLQQDLKKATAIIAAQTTEIEQQKQQNNTLKIANSLLGSEDNKRDTKLKINTLIREIDFCITQLSD